MTDPIKTLHPPGRRRIVLTLEDVGTGLAAVLHPEKPSLTGERKDEFERQMNDESSLVSRVLREMGENQRQRRFYRAGSARVKEEALRAMQLLEERELIVRFVRKRFLKGQIPKDKAIEVLAAGAEDLRNLEILGRENEVYSPGINIAGRNPLQLYQDLNAAMRQQLREAMPYVGEELDKHMLKHLKGRSHPRSGRET